MHLPPKLALVVCVALGAGCGARVHPKWTPDAEAFALVGAVVAHRQTQRDEQVPFLDDDALHDLHDHTTGIGDYHIHQFSELGFGHRVVHGGPAPCDGDWHGLSDGFLPLLIRAPHLLGTPMISDLVPHCTAYDLPSSDGWTHEQYGTADLREAHEHGLRLVVNYAVNNTVLCALAGHYGSDLSLSCADAPNIDAQLLASWDFAYENDWYEIALDPIDAHHAMAEGNLAVVLGVEASDYLDYGFRGGILGQGPLARRAAASSACSPEEDRVRHGAPWRRSECGIAADAVAHVEARGVRSIMPSHEWNSALSGAAFQNTDLFQPGYAIVNRRGTVHRLSLLGVGAPFVGFGAKRQAISRWPMPGEVVRDPLLNTEYPRNLQGLTPMGRAFLLHARDAGFVIDVAHGSERATAETIELFMARRHDDRRDPPMLLSSHVTPRLASLAGSMTYEYLVGAGVLDGLRLYGRAALGIRTGSEPTRWLDPDVENCLYRWKHPDPKVGSGEWVCGETGEPIVLAPGDAVALTQTWRYLQQFGLPIGFGTDMNGGATQVSRRRCFDGEEPVSCFREAAELNGYAARGLATIAELPSLTRDLTCIEAEGDANPSACLVAAKPLAANEDVCAGSGSTLCQSAPAFVRTWAGSLVPPPRRAAPAHHPGEQMAFQAANPAVSQLARATRDPGLEGAYLQAMATGGPRAASDRVLGQVGASSIIDVTASGEFVVTDPRSARQLLRKLRRKGLLGPSCVPLGELIEQAEEEE